METHHLTVPRTARFSTLGVPGAPWTWLACHGYGQLAASFLGYLRPALTADRLLVAPEALSRFYHDNGLGPIGASWMTREDREHEIGDYLAYLDRLRAELVSRFQAGAVALLGFSQGVATASRWMCHGAEPVLGAVLWAGSVAPELDPARLRERVQGRPVVLVAGDRDQYLTPDWIRRERERFEQAGADCREVVFHGGHRLDRTVLAEAMEFVEHHGSAARG